ncbi:MAG TPA: LuxR C-terminal-related transcriptional regulator [Vicinamibacterales bacterium]|nr:LuxR C-terminal-related transcriptional regulator [Vicinamibacterales bacterium]
MVEADDTLERGRDAFLRRRWAEAHALLAAADQHNPLQPDDLERLATAAYLVGRDAESTEIWTRAHQQHLGLGAAGRAARCAFWLAAGLAHRGERTRAAAWIARAREVLQESTDCVEHGYLLLPQALERLLGGDAAGAYEMFCQAATIGDRHGDRDLIALARHSRGRVLIRMGEIRDGVRLLDDAMIAVDAGDVSPLAAGEVYCSVIEGCLEIYDLARAREWTAALTRWCEAQPDLVPFRGQCLVRRAEILQVQGAWPEAVEAARQACDRLLNPSPQPASGAAFYQCGELQRLRGAFQEADEAYRQANRYGRTPQPGLALLRLAQGRTEAAAAGIRLALDAARGTHVRSRLLPACVEIMLAAGDLRAARLAADELAEIAEGMEAPVLHAMAAQAHGAVLLAEGDARAALPVLRQAWRLWQEVDAVYDAARVRVLIGLASRDLGDVDAAEMELDAARSIFDQLGARPELARVDALSRALRPAATGGLSGRELQVLRLVAAGKTNRQIAAELFISERTVERHLSNIFNKLGLSSRAAATAYAYEHHLL